VVFHCATMAPSAENAASKALAYDVNVRGTENVIEVSNAPPPPLSVVVKRQILQVQITAMDDI